MLTNKLLLCVIFLPIFTCVDLMLSSSEEQRLKQIIDLIFTKPNLIEVRLEPSNNVMNISENANCKCVCNIRIEEDPCYNFNNCCETEKNIVYPDPKPVGCGIRNEFGIGARMLNSEKALFGEFPWTVAVLLESGVDEHNKTFLSFQCGGSVIHPQVILTAAHCVLKPFRQYHIRAGEWDTRETVELYPHQNRKVQEIIIHYQFDKPSLVNDIALLILKEPLLFAENVQSVCLPPPGEIVEHANKCYASGWGLDVLEMKYQAILKKVEVLIVPLDICEKRLRNTQLGKSFFLSNGFICAGGMDKRDACQGDGGSPLVCPISSNSKQYHQSGIVSWGVGCGESNIPGIYVNVALYRNWIDYHMESRKFGTSTYTYNAS